MGAVVSGRALVDCIGGENMTCSLDDCVGKVVARAIVR